MAAISFIPESLDLNCYAGDGAAVRIVVSSSGATIDVSGDHEAQIRVKKLDTDPLDEFIIDDSDAANGVLLMSLTGEQTALLGDGFKGVWDMQWTATDGQPKTLVRGTITCTLDVTRP